MTVQLSHARDKPAVLSGHWSWSQKSQLQQPLPPAPKSQFIHCSSWHSHSSLRWQWLVLPWTRILLIAEPVSSKNTLPVGLQLPEGIPVSHHLPPHPFWNPGFPITGVLLLPYVPMVSSSHCTLYSRIKAWNPFSLLPCKLHDSGYHLCGVHCWVHTALHSAWDINAHGAFEEWTNKRMNKWGPCTSVALGGGFAV